MMKTRWLLPIFVALTLLCGCDSEKMRRGNEVVAKVEKFRSEQGRLPDSAGEIGVVETESGPVCYRKQSDTRYLVWFGKELGEPMTYDSDEKEWR